MTQQVFIVHRDVDYEFGEVYSVHSTKELANKVVEDMKRGTLTYDDNGLASREMDTTTYSVQMWGVDEEN